ncbi:MAG: hypothetical protein HY564_03535 [Candidatus Jacksonbacteria bacterium]|nr:hypothetical protein [Candidatus Jacksonbacteria bacterium]
MRNTNLPEIHKGSEPKDDLEKEIESQLENARHDQLGNFTKEINELQFFGHFPIFISGLQEKNYDDHGLSESMEYDTPLQNLVNEKERKQYSEKRLTLTQREFLRILYQAAADAGYTREWLQEICQKADHELSSDEHTQYREALKKMYLVLRRQGFSHSDIVA